MRTQLAERLGCQSAFISKVLNGDAHFSLEHAAVISDFLEHVEEERHQFLLLAHHGRAGSRKLADYYRAQIEGIRRARREIKQRVRAHEARPLTSEEQAIYYSSWHYVAIHVLVSVRRFATREALAAHLALRPREVARYLDFLLGTGILAERDGALAVGSRRMHLGTDSPLLARHHTNWRMRAIHSLDQAREEAHAADLHYSTVISFAEADLEKIREALLQSVERVESIMKPSSEETVYCVALDLFRI